MDNTARRRFLIQSEQGLTLIEMVVVAALLAMMLSMLYGTMNGIISTRQAVESKRVTGATTRRVIERLSKELSSRVAEEVTGGENSNQDSDGATFRGFQRTYFIGQNKKESQQDADTLRFVSATGSQAAFGAQANYGYVELFYSLEDPPQSEGRSRNRDIPPTKMLVRIETPAGVRDERLRSKRTVVLPIAEDIVSFNLRYLKGDNWNDSWDNAQRGLPDAVEITLGVLGVDQQIHAVSSVVPISFGASTQGSTFSGFQ